MLFAWLQLALANRYEPAVPAAERFLTGMGRRKFVSPLFETLIGEGEWGRPIAQRIYARARTATMPSRRSRSTASCAGRAEKSRDFRPISGLASRPN